MLTNLLNKYDIFSEGPYLKYPSEDKKWKFVLQAHLRGKSVHGDLRMQISSDILVGYTLNWIKSIPREATSLTDAKKLIDAKLPQAWKDLNDPQTKIVTELKKPEPAEWMTIEAEFPEGSVGATKYKKGYMIIVDEGEVEFGALKTSYREYFFHGKHIPPELSVRQLPNIWRQRSLHTGEPEKTGKGYTVWMTFASKPDPYVLSPRAKKEDWYPPKGISALPKKVRDQIPSEFQYWKKSDQKDAHKLRDELIKEIKAKNIVIKYSDNPGGALFNSEGTLFNPAGSNPFNPVLTPDLTELFAKVGRKKLPEAKKKIKKPKINKASTPTASVLEKITSTLFYKPPDHLHFKWNLTGREECPDCKWLSEQGFIPLKRLPTYPREGKTMCADRCDCTLDVVFPATRDYPQRSYRLLPVKDRSLYESDWIRESIVKDWADSTAKDIVPLWTRIMIELDHLRDQLKAMIIDVANMDKIDKAFMLFAGQPLIKDTIIVYRQAAREVFESLPLDKKEELSSWSFKERTQAYETLRNRHGEVVEAIVVRLLTEGQIKEVEAQLGGFENFLLEYITSVMLVGVTKTFFKTLVAGIKKLKDFTKVPIIGSIIKSAITEASQFRTKALTEQIKLAHIHTRTFIDKLGVWGMQVEKVILDEIDYFISFWKDAVLIFMPGTACRNMADNTLKAINEMINSVLEARPFWAFYTGQNKQILNIPRAVVNQTWAKTAADIQHLDDMAKVGVNWYQRLRMTLYRNLLSKPESWARAGLYAGKMGQYERALIAVGKNPEQFEKLMRTKAIAEVNRVFFDYSRRMAIEVPLGRLAPFVTYNIRNFNYWLRDFMLHPWKLGVIRGLWQWWSRTTGSNCEFKLKDKIPLYLIPGVFFNPLSWLSAYKFIKVFAMYKGEPKWITARDRHLKWQAEQLKKLPPEVRSKILSKSKAKSVQDYLDRQKYKWIKVSVEFLDEWLGLFPVWKKVLAELQLAEREEWKKVFPQSPLIDAMTSSMFNRFYGSIKPPGTVALRDIYEIMKIKGFSEVKILEDKIAAKIITKDLEKRRKEARKIDREVAGKIYRAWEVQKIVIGYSTGMWLTRSYKAIYNTHKAMLEEME